MNIVSIGDIHGNYQELMQLYEKILQSDFTPKKDKLIVLGDMVDGGDDVKGVVDQCISWSQQYPHWVFLRGNHEDMLLDALVGDHKKYKSFNLWWNQGGRATTRSYIKALGNKLTEFEKDIANPVDVIPVEHLEWLNNLPYYHEEEDYFFVHAGIPACIKAKNFIKHVQEGDAWYMDRALWIRDEFINDTKTDYGKKIIYGHTPSEKPNVMKNKIGIDTMTRNGGTLTAILLPEETFLTVKKEGQWW